MTRTLFLLLGLLVFFSSCKKDDKDVITDTDQLSAKDFSKLFASYTDAVKIAEDIMDSNYGARIATTNIGCTSIVIDSNATEKVYTVSFTDPCSDYDGYKRSGSIIVTVTNSTGKKYNNAGAITNITFSNYVYRGGRLHGSINMECIDNTQYRIKLTGTSGSGSAEFWPEEDASLSISLGTNLLRTTVSGEADAYLLNNEYEYKPYNGGNSYGSFKNSSGDQYTVTFSEKIRQNNSCYYDGFGRYPVEGLLTFTDSEDDAFDLQYGSGNCDNNVTLVRNNTTKDVTY